MERWKGRVALVTGASVGIGAAVARALVQQGMRVVGCARNVDKIEVCSFVEYDGNQWVGTGAEARIREPRPTSCAS